MEELEIKLERLYSETEDNKPPMTFNSSEKFWNDGFYAGQLKALELVSQRLFNKNGDNLATKQGADNDS